MYGAHTLLAVACITSKVSFGTTQTFRPEQTDTYNCIQTSCSFGICEPESACIANGTNGCLKIDLSGGLFIEQGCSDTPCVPDYTNYYGSEVTTDCCFSEKCNTGTMTSTVDNPEINECYSVVCEKDRNCVSKAAADGDARLCPMPEGGVCKFTYLVGEFSAGIAECLVDDANCANSAMYDMDTDSGAVQQCCNQDMCNDGSMEKIPDIDYCYSLTCTGGERCIAAAIKYDVFLYCAQKGFGCVTQEKDGTYMTGCSSVQCDGSTGNCCFGDLCNRPAGLISRDSTTRATGSADSTDFFYGSWTDSTDFYYGFWTDRFVPPTRTEPPVISGTGSIDSTDFYYGFWTDRFVPPTRTEPPVISGTGSIDSTDFYYGFWTDRFVPPTRTEPPVISGTGSIDSTDVYYSSWTDIFVPQTQATSSTQTPHISGGSTEKSAGNSGSKMTGTSATETTGSSISEMTKTSAPKTAETLAPETAGTSKPEVTTPGTVMSSTGRSDTNSPTKGTGTSIISGASKTRSFTSLMSLLLLSFVRSALLSAEVEM